MWFLTYPVKIPQNWLIFTNVYNIWWIIHSEHFEILYHFKVEYYTGIQLKHQGIFPRFALDEKAKQSVKPAGILCMVLYGWKIAFIKGWSQAVGFEKAVLNVINPGELASFDCSLGLGT